MWDKIIEKVVELLSHQCEINKTHNMWYTLLNYIWYNVDDIKLYIKL